MNFPILNLMAVIVGKAMKVVWYLKTQTPECYQPPAEFQELIDAVEAYEEEVDGR